MQAYFALIEFLCVVRRRILCEGGLLTQHVIVPLEPPHLGFDSAVVPPSRSRVPPASCGASQPKRICHFAPDSV